MKRFFAYDDNHKAFDAEIYFETLDEVETYFVSSRGGKKSGPSSRNPDYNEALEALFQHHKTRNSVLEDILVDSKIVKEMHPALRRVESAEINYPLNMNKIEDVSQFRRNVGNIVKDIGKRNFSKGGNSNKKLLIRFRVQSKATQTKISFDKIEQFHQKKFLNSGPPPSFKRSGSYVTKHATGFVYAFWLSGLKNGKNAVKVGYTRDLKSRFQNLNKQLISSVSGLRWRAHTYFQLPNPMEAYHFEQQLHYILKSYRYRDEREIYDLSTTQFDSILLANGY